MIKGQYINWKRNLRFSLAKNVENAIMCLTKEVISFLKS